MRAFFALTALLLVLLPAPAETVAPWKQAQTILDAAIPDLNKSGIQGMQSHAADFELALADASKPYDNPNPNEVIVLTDGMMDTLATSAEAAKANPGKTIVSIHDPYPMMALYLASYYNEIGRFADALRVLEREKVRNPGTLGDGCAALTSERAVALMQLKRLPEALAVYEEGLKLGNIDDRGKARMHRGRGYVLTEMGRLDEAEAAYNESLKLEPGNRIALGELEYIAKLKAGGDKAPGGIVLPQPKSN